MTNRERFRKALNFEPVDRLPILEWAIWWDQTISRWHSEGLPQELVDEDEIRQHFGLDSHRQCWISPLGPTCPPPAGHGMPIITDRDSYLEVRKHLYPNEPFDPKVIEQWAKRQESGETVIWITVEGFFWVPRTLFGIEPHLYAFYDQPDLMHEINEDLLAYNLHVIDSFCQICVPDFMTFAEDMSYNHGPMLSKAQSDEFVAPYYRRIVPDLNKREIVTIVDTDGNVTEPAKWFAEVGVEGVLPLERMAGVDVAQLRETNPKLRMIGGFDKTVMHLGEERMREEFERLLPVMRQGGFIPSVDHQTPPAVSMKDYRTYVGLLRDYCGKAGCVNCEHTELG
ncbi:MAG: uroporphyrinogen decarboxylase family protein [Armatimonadota bacterium]